VGRNFQDHYLTFSVYRAKPDVESFDDFVRGDPEVQKRVFEEWNLKGTGPLATNGIDAGVKIRPTKEELDEMKKWPTPEFVQGWETYFKNKPDKPVMHYSVISGYGLLFPLSLPFGLILVIVLTSIDGSATTCSCPQANSSPCSTSWYVPPSHVPSRPSPSDY
jgi:hypothetical protein